MNLEKMNARNAFAVVPSNTVDLPRSAFALWVGGAGDLAIDTVGGQTVTLVAVPAGTYINIQTKRVRATSTATNIVALS